MFTPEHRARLRSDLLQHAAADRRISGAAITGSVAVDREDQWSDIDLAFGVADEAQLPAVLSDWTGHMYQQHGALHHLDLQFGAWTYRVFILPGTLQVDLAFVPAGEFRAIAPSFRLVSGEANEARYAPPADPAVLAGFALLYGVCETTNGNWASLYMTKELGASATQASLALTVFWGMVTAGRILFAVVEKWWPERAVFQVLPLLVAAGLVVLAFLQPTQPLFGIPAFALAGFGCSALLPLVISFGQAELKAIAASVAGGLIASYQIGYGIAAFGVGPLESRLGLSLGAIYGATTGVALALAVLAVLIARHPARLIAEAPRVRVQSPIQTSTITHPGDEP